MVPSGLGWGRTHGQSAQTAASVAHRINHSDAEAALSSWSSGEHLKHITNRSSPIGPLVVLPGLSRACEIDEVSAFIASVFVVLPG